MPFDSEPTITTGTKGQRRLHNLLFSLGFEVEDEKKFGQYFVDCYIEEVHCGFEYDGADFHSSARAKRKDRARDEWLFEMAGLPIFRVPESTIWNHELDSMIESFIDKWAETISTRKELGKVWL